jgi:hypothetical protein
MKSRKRLMELAGLSATEDAALNYFGMDDTIEWDNEVEGFKSLLQHADESDEEVESLENINKRSDMLYPGKKYYGMYAGERMMESNPIDKLNEDDSIDLSPLF